MSEFHAFLHDTIELIDQHRADPLQTAKAVRELMQQALRRESFRVACARRIKSSIVSTGGPWRNPPLYRSSDPPVTVRMFYWPPGLKNEPHLHEDWTVTGVFYNQIVVQTFAEEAPPPDAVPSKLIEAHVGDVGYLMPPCVHSLYNNTQSDAATLHIFCTEHHSNAPPPTAAEGGGAMRRNGWSARRSALCISARMLASATTDTAVALLQEIYEIGDPTVRLDVVKALMRHDVRLAYKKSRELEAGLSGATQEALATINRRFADLCAAN